MTSPCVVARAWWTDVGVISMCPRYHPRDDIHHVEVLERVFQSHLRALLTVLQDGKQC